MERRTFYFSLLTLSLAACSNVETRKQANGNFDYVNAKPESKFVVPENLHQPEDKPDYLIPELENSDGPVGIKVDVRAPALVLPLAAGSRVDEFDKTAAVWFDKVDDDRDLRETVIKVITDYLATEDVGFVSADEANNTWESEWFHVEEESGYLFWKNIDLTESWRFKYSLVTKPHGRSVGLNVELVEYMHTSDKGSKTLIDPIEKQRVEMGMINAITAQLDYQYRLYNKEDRLARATMEIVTLGQSANNKPAYIIDYPVDELWNYLPGFFDSYNFKISDLNEDKFIYEVEYERIDPSLWDMIWGDELPVVEIESGVYEFHLTELDGKTALEIYNDEGEILSDQVLIQNFEILEPALSFRF
ncbi:outer membrane protein assembly factor BamC [Thalassomonas sp. M1454]|uniref:outer membrane protein assembly factor BamC n=1 Tax=Thalassomonas sp. M1454 TaxID=2594477 RepID=UPI00118039C6|nr:outer membrane protein assembly factor BamC [Thalassomonas sp. M1454]TRX56714.1 outer membrane protein assembly factor BamC [Thalassomonas sp. M1454]